MNENENLNTQNSGTSEPSMDYSFDFSNQVGVKEDSVATEPAAAPVVEAPASQTVEQPVVQEQAVSSETLATPEAPMTSPEVMVAAPEVPEQLSEPAVSVSDGVEMPEVTPLSEPAPQMEDVSEAPVVGDQAPTPEVVQSNPEVMPSATQAPEAAPAQQAEVAGTPQEASVEAVQPATGEQEENKKLLKSGKSTIIFLIIIVAIVAAFIISLPYLINIGR